eukprot:Skav213836  [mRNA]  locus=scaffold315:142106:146525:+ [translate_table: standard]
MEKVAKAIDLESSANEEHDTEKKGEVQLLAMSPPRKKTRHAGLDGGELSDDDDDDVVPVDAADEMPLPDFGAPRSPQTTPSMLLAQANNAQTPEQLMQLLPAMLTGIQDNLGRKLDMLHASQQAILSTVDSHSSQLATNSAQIAQIDARMQVLETQQVSNQDIHRQVAHLQHEFKGLSATVQELKRAPSAPPMASRAHAPDLAPRAASTSPLRPRHDFNPPMAPTYAMGDMDWNRLILGGWHMDTRRETIENEAKTLLQTLDITNIVREVVVYGRRASTCHVLLQPLPESEAKRRLLKLKVENQDQHVLPSSGKKAWLTQHKSAQKRLNNRATKFASDLLQHVSGPSGSGRIDADWNKQILWLDDARMVAFKQSDLRANASDTIHATTYSDSKGSDHITFYLDLTRMSSATGKPIAALEQAVASWNVRGKNLTQVADVLSDQRIHFDVLAFQEVGGIAQGTTAADGPPLLATCRDEGPPALKDHWIICTDDLKSHLGQATLIDKSYADCILQTLKGSRFIGARILHKSGTKIWFFSGHLPHHQLPAVDYTSAIRELHHILQRKQNAPCLICADWNIMPTDANTDAQCQDFKCLVAEENLELIMPREATCKHRTYDFFVANPNFMRMVAPEALPLTPPLVFPHLDSLLPTDHKLVNFNTVLLFPSIRRCAPRRQSRAGKWSVDRSRLAAGLQEMPSALPLTWHGICQLSRSCHYRTRSRKYQDSVELKQLCAIRNNEANPAMRASLTRRILALRRQERATWVADLHAAAVAGDTAAIAFLHNRRKPSPDWSCLIATSVAHTTLLVEALNMYIPEVSDREAHQLLRLRRHVAKHWVRCATSEGAWPTQCLRRFWTYIGHISRQDHTASHPARVMLHHVARTHSSGLMRPGPWHTAHALMQKCWKENSLPHDYLYLAQDREEWKRHCPTFLAWMGHSSKFTKLEFLPCNPWETKGSLLRQQVHWLHTSLLHIEEGILTLSWLDTIEGRSVLTTPLPHPFSALDIMDCVISLENILRMKYQPFLQQIAILQETTWLLFPAAEDACHDRLLSGRAAWYQFFPVDPPVVASDAVQAIVH